MIARILSRLLRWLDRRRAVSDVQQFARRRGLTPIEVAAVSRLVRTHYDAYGSRPPGARIAWLVVSVEEAQ